MSFAVGTGLRGLKTLHPTPTGSYRILLSYSPTISMAVNMSHREQGRAIGLVQCQLLVSAGANQSWVRVCYGMEKVLTEPGLAARCSPACEGTVKFIF